MKLLVTNLEGAKITFFSAPTDVVIRLSCLLGSCNMAFDDGFVLASDAGVPLERRAINMWRPIVNSPGFDSLNGIMPIHIMGCGGFDLC